VVRTAGWLERVPVLRVVRDSAGVETFSRGERTAGVLEVFSRVVRLLGWLVLGVVRLVRVGVSVDRLAGVVRVDRSPALLLPGTDRCVASTRESVSTRVVLLVEGVDPSARRETARVPVFLSSILMRWASRVWVAVVSAGFLEAARVAARWRFTLGSLMTRVMRAPLRKSSRSRNTRRVVMRTGPVGRIWLRA